MFTELRQYTITASGTIASVFSAELIAESVNAIGRQNGVENITVSVVESDSADVETTQEV